ncbi:MAG: SAM-dependent methyltransferase, partial [bacterium]
HPLVAAHRSARFASWGLPVADLTAGLGGDLTALAASGLHAVGLERDPAHALFAAANVGVSVARGDAASPPFDIGRMAVVIDPSRREGGPRRFDPSAFSPPWDVALALANRAKAAVIKAPPGLGAEFVPSAAELEAVQLGGSMRETAVWFGADVRPGLRRATLLPAGVNLDSDEPEASAEPVGVGPVLFDPESCVTRATLVTHLAYRLGARLMDPYIAYLTAPEPAFSPFAATFEVLESLPFSVARLKERLRAGSWKPDEIRRRAFPVEPDDLRKLLGKLEGSPVTLLLTTLGGRRTVFICRRLFASD